MGYRSDVAYIIAFPSIKERDEYVALFRLGADEYQRRALDETNYEHSDRPIITFREGDVKWYPSFEDVQAHVFLYEHAVEVNPRARYRFIAIGEDGQESYAEDGSDDIDLYEDLYAVHRLETSW